MSISAANRICRDCKKEFPSAQATRSDGALSPRGVFCSVCGPERARLEIQLIHQRKANVLRNLWAAYGAWWKHYTPPLGWKELLRSEGDNCPYCGVVLTDWQVVLSVSTAVVDHMDPLSLGGEDSLRNAVCCCARCNSLKKNKSFTKWLTELSSECRSLSREIYEFKHKHPPEAFVQGAQELRMGHIPMFLELDELQFNKDLRGRLPLVNEPPSQYLEDLVSPHSGPVNINELLYKRPKRE